MKALSIGHLFRSGVVLRPFSARASRPPSAHDPGSAADVARNQQAQPSPMRIITEETKPDDLGPPSGAMVGDPLDPNTWADGAEGGLARADAYEPKHREAYHVEKADSTTSAGDTPSPIELGGKARIVTPLKEAPEHSPPPDSKKEPTKGGEGSHVEYVNVLGSPENIHAMDHQGKAGDEVARELHEKGP